MQNSLIFLPAPKMPSCSSNYSFFDLDVGHLAPLAPNFEAETVLIILSIFLGSGTFSRKCWLAGWLSWFRGVPHHHSSTNQILHGGAGC